MPKITFRLTDPLLDAVMIKLETSNYNNRSELLRDLLRRWLNSVPIEMRVHEPKK